MFADRRSTLQFFAFVAVLLVSRASLADHYVVPTGSMIPSVEVGDRVMVNKAAYGVRIPSTHVYLVRTATPQVGDVVVLTSPEDETNLLKRIVAGPGQRVTVREGRVTLDGGHDVPHPPDPVYGLSEEVLGPKVFPIRHIPDGGPDLGPIRVPGDHYLVMGDNRGDSHDGRAFGFVPAERILGRCEGVFFRDGFTWHPL